MNTSEIMVRMIAFSDQNHRDINHFMKVHSFARTIGVLEQLDDETQFILETAAIVHDIACPLCREKYGSTAGKYQEMEGMIIAREFLADTGMTQGEIDRVVYLVGHHHTLHSIDGADYQILIEADYLVNADESGYSKDNIRSFGETYFKTAAGKNLLHALYGI